MSDMTPPALSKRQRIAARRNRLVVNLANGETAIAPSAAGRPPSEDARKVALEGRVRVYGLNTNEGQLKAIKRAIAPFPTSSQFAEYAEAARGAKKEIKDAAAADQKKAMEDASSPSQKDDVTRCISAILTAPSLIKELEELWGTLIAMDRQYGTRILGRTASPQGSAMPMLSEPMQTDQSHTIDTRTSEERATDAIRAHRHWWGKIKALHVPQMIWVIRSALSGNIGGLGAEMWRDGKPTAKGSMMVQALLALHRGVK